MAFCAAPFAPAFAAAAPADNFVAAENLLMATADPDYFINPLDDNNSAANFNPMANDAFACNPTLNESCVWQCFVEDSAAFPCENEVCFMQICN